MAWDRIIVHADMDAFYAAVEQLDNEELRGKPILVGHPGGRGVVTTASYEARPFGVGSAMPMAKARRLCPQAIIVAPRFERYTQVSQTIMEVFADFSPDVEAISLDEAFMDLSGAQHIFGGPADIGRKIKAAVFEATGGLHVSVGISGTKYVAKVASDFKKPDGLTVVPQEHAVEFLRPMPVRRLWGSGPKTSARLNELGYHTIGDIQEADPLLLERTLGVRGRHFYELSWARDKRHVEGRRSMKSIGHERTLEEDVRDPEVIKQHLRRAADAIAKRLRKKGRRARGVRVKLKTSSFCLRTRQLTLPESTDLASKIYAAGVALLDHFEHSEPYRLIGMATYDFTKEEVKQLDLFATAAPRPGDQARPPQRSEEQDKHRRDLEAAVDALHERFGLDAVVRGESVGRKQRTAPNLDFLEPADK